METVAVAVPEAISAEAFNTFVERAGGYLVPGPGVQYCVERGEGGVYLSLLESDTDEDSMRRVRDRVSWEPRGLVLLTVSRRDGSLFLAFELAHSIATRWRGHIDWAGMSQWEEWFQNWKSAHE